MWTFGSHFPCSQTLQYAKILANIFPCWLTQVLAIDFVCIIPTMREISYVQTPAKYTIFADYILCGPIYCFRCTYLTSALSRSSLICGLPIRKESIRILLLIDLIH